LTDDVLLSRLLDDDLPVEEARALRARVDRDPALAARFVAMQAMVGRLGALPASIPPPGQPAVLGTTAVPPSPRALPAPSGQPPARSHREGRAWRGAFFGACAAAVVAGLVATVHSPKGRAVLLDGETVVDGHARVLAGGLAVDVDGRARISVEPPRGGPRVDGAEIVTMDRSHLAAALAGAVVTMTVYEGSARFESTPEGEASTLSAGERLARRVRGGNPAEPDPLAGRSGATASPAARIAELERQLAAARQEAGIQRGIVTLHEGVPQAWVGRVSDVWRPDAFRTRLDDAVAGVPGARVVRVDCEEFPCVAILRPPADADDWVDLLTAVPERMNADGAFGATAVIGMASATGDGDAEVRHFALALEPGPADPAVETRTRYRAQTLLAEYADEGGDDGLTDEERAEREASLEALGRLDYLL
jgi:hypothetical protein